MTISTETRADSPDQPCLQYLDMIEDWQRIEDLNGGTRAMRAGRYLPRVKNEKDSEYDARISRAFLTEIYGDTVADLVAMPFRQNVTIEGLPGKMAFLESDVDGWGTSLTSFAAQLLQDMIDYGLFHGFVDYSTVMENVVGPQPASRAQEEQGGARPIFQRWKPSSVISWRLSDGDRPEVVRLLDFEDRPREGTQFLDQRVKLVRQWTPEDYSVFRILEAAPRGEVGYEIESAVEVKARGKALTEVFGGLPHVVAYAQQDGPFQAHPALRALAEVNIAHFQTDGDMRNALRVAAFALLTVKGWKPPIPQTSDEDNEEFPAPAPTNVYLLEEGGEMEFVEHTGASIEASRNALKDLEERSERLGAQPVARESSAKTATGANIDETRNMSQLEAWVRELEKGLEQMFRYAAGWMGVEMPDEFAVRVFDEFTTEERSTASLEFLGRLNERGIYPTEQLLAKLQRAGHLPDGVDVADLAAEIERAQAAMAGGEAIPDPDLDADPAPVE